MICPSSGEVNLTVGGPISGGAVRLHGSPEVQCVGGGGACMCDYACTVMTVGELSFVLDLVQSHKNVLGNKI